MTLEANFGENGEEIGEEVDRVLCCLIVACGVVGLGARVREADAGG